MPEFGIASRLVAPKIDPLAIAGQAQQVQAGALNNRMLGQNVEQTLAQRRAAQASVNPDGTFDANKYVGQLGIEGASPEALAGAQQQKLAQLQEQIGKLGLSKADLELTSARWKKIGDVSKALLGTRGPDGQPLPLTREAVTAAMKNDLIASGMFNTPDAQAQVVNFLTNLPDDPAQIAQSLKHIGLQSDMTSETIGQLIGAPRDTDTGSNIVTRQTSPLTGETGTVATMAKGRTPSEKAALVDTYDEAGQRVVKKTSGELVGDGPAAAAPIAGGPRLGEPQAVQASTALRQKDIQTAGTYNVRAQGLQKAYDSLQKAATGPGTGRVQNYGAVLNSFGMKAPTDVNSYAEANKYLQDYANSRSADLGMGTDASRALVNAANPGVNTPKGAALHVLNVLQGLERMQASMVAAAKRDGVTDGNYANWKAEWGRTVDPAAFAPPKLTSEGWEAKRKELGDKWPAYQKGLQAALDAGVIKPSDLRK